MKKIEVILFIAVHLYIGCSPKEKANPSIDYETIAKDENFRTSINTGNFVQLSAGFTYYE